MKFKINNKVIVLILINILIILFIFWQNNYITITKINYVNEKIPVEFNGYKIAHISDLHNKDFGNKQSYLINKIKEISPDVIFITGDLIDKRFTNIDVSMEFINQAVNIAPIYYIPGNHEAYIEEYDDLKYMLLNSGITILDDKSIEIKKDNSSIDLLGLVDPNFYIKSKQILNTEDRLSEISKSDKFKILLSHRPELLDIYEKNNIDLVFCGHAHGGQFRIPYVLGMFAPNQGFLPKYTSGIYKKNLTSMIVSRGIGNSILPIRIFNRPEIIQITLNRN